MIIILLYFEQCYTFWPVKNSRRHFTRQIIFSKSLLFSTLPPSPNFSSKYSNLHARKRNQRITPVNFFPQRVSIRERSFRKPYKIPSGQLRSPSEIRNDSPSKNPPHFITSRRPPLSPLQPSLQKEEKKEEEVGDFSPSPSHYNIVNRGEASFL